MNTSQLRLVAAKPDWKLDQETKDIGRRGLLMARRALQAHTNVGADACGHGRVVRGAATQEPLAA